MATGTRTRDMIFWGGTGQAKVMRGVASALNWRVAAIVDDTPGLPSPFTDIPILHGADAFERWLSRRAESTLGFAITIGNPHGAVRLRLDNYLSQKGLSPTSLVHPTAWISPDCLEIGAGIQVHAGAVVEYGARLGRQVILNTGSIVDHECHLEDGVEIAPGATLCGLVRVGTCAWVGAGATVLPRVEIGARAIVGAGSTVIRSVPPHVTVVGNPANRILNDSSPQASASDRHFHPMV